MLTVPSVYSRLILPLLTESVKLRTYELPANSETGRGEERGDPTIPPIYPRRYPHGAQRGNSPLSRIHHPDHQHGEQLSHYWTADLITG